jgi:hypothetical protein
MVDSPQSRQEKSARQLHAIAIHEAGHAVVYWCLGTSFKEVTIIPDPSSTFLGRVVVKHPRWYRRDVDTYPSTPKPLSVTRILPELHRRLACRAPRRGSIQEAPTAALQLLLGPRELLQ